MSADGDTDLTRTLHRLVTGLLDWLDEIPADQVDPEAAARIRGSVDWVIAQLPAGEQVRLASGDPDPKSLPVVVGLLVDVVWWLDTCDEDEVDSHLAVKMLEDGLVDLDDLPDAQRDRLVAVLAALAVSEPHDTRRYQLRFFPFGMNLTDDEPEDDEPTPRDWVSPQARHRE